MLRLNYTTVVTAMGNSNAAVKEKEENIQLILVRSKI
jgi:hypothetical protein